MKTRSAKIVTGLWWLILSWGMGGQAVGQFAQSTVLASFAFTNGGFADGGVTLGTDGNFYGTTYEDRGSGYGTVFRITINGTLTSLLNFTDTNGMAPGAYPDAPLALGTDGNLYGVTLLGGTNGSGTIFKVTTNGTLTSLVSFGPVTGTRSELSILSDPPVTNATGAEPDDELTQGPDGNFYGTTIYGGTNGVGTVFKMSTNGVLTSLFSFDALAANGSTNGSGAKPVAGLALGPDGLFYGMAAAGGNGGYGTVFKITTNGAFNPFFSFTLPLAGGDGHTNNTGGEPLARLILGTDGNFYGAASYGGLNGNGTVFRITTNGNFAVLHTFGLLASDGIVGGSEATNADGAQPNKKLTPGPNGSFYGIASNGGQGAYGTIFNITTNGTFTLLYTFAPLNFTGDTEYGTNTTGGEPDALTPGPDGSFYSTTYEGGDLGIGVVFKVTIGPPLNIQLLSGKPVLTWPNPVFNLQSAPAVTGAFSTIGGAVSPYTNPPTSAQRFFRLMSN